MNPLPPNADELVSAYLDGQAAPDEVAIVESSPELMDRVDTLRSISNLLGTPLATPPEQKEAHISVALDAFDSLFASDNPAGPAEQVAPQLAAAPPATTKSSPAGEQPAAVTSLSDARERRRPRRFNSGIIAAAAATVLLFVALAAFGLGGDAGQDLATTAIDADFSASTDDTADTAQIESAEAMADEDAMAAEEGSIALSEAQPPAAAPRAAEAMEEEAMEEAAMDEEEAADDTAEFDEAEEATSDGDDSASDDAAGSGAAEPFDAAPTGFLGEFATQKSLQLELEQLRLEGLDQRVEPLEPGLFASCQQDVPELADIEVSTLIGQASIVEQAVEVHQIIADDGTVTILIVDTTNCTVLPTTP